MMKWVMLSLIVGLLLFAGCYDVAAHERIATLEFELAQERYDVTEEFVGLQLVSYENATYFADSNIIKSMKNPKYVAWFRDCWGDYCSVRVVNATPEHARMNNDRMRDWIKLVGER